MGDSETPGLGICCFYLRDHISQYSACRRLIWLWRHFLLLGLLHHPPGWASGFYHWPLEQILCIAVLKAEWPFYNMSDDVTSPFQRSQHLPVSLTVKASACAKALRLLHTSTSCSAFPRDILLLSLPTLDVLYLFVYCLSPQRCKSPEGRDVFMFIYVAQCGYSFCLSELLLVSLPPSFGIQWPHVAPCNFLFS